MTFLINRNRVIQLIGIAIVCCLVQLIFTLELCAFQVYTWKDASENGTGKIYCGREIAYLMSSQNALWLERKDRLY